LRGTRFHRLSPGYRLGHLVKKSVGRFVIVRRVVRSLHPLTQLFLIEILPAQIEQRIGGGVERGLETREPGELVDRRGYEKVSLRTIPFDIAHAAELYVGLIGVSLVMMRADSARWRPRGATCSIAVVIAPFIEPDAIVGSGIHGQAQSRIQSAGTRPEDRVIGHRYSPSSVAERC